VTAVILSGGSREEEVNSKTLTTGSAELLKNRIGKEVLIGSDLCFGSSSQFMVRPLFLILKPSQARMKLI
jgi:hypothetical protein